MTTPNLINEELIAKWKPILEHEDMTAIKDINRRNTTAIVLENTQNALKEGTDWSPKSLLEAAPTNNMGAGNIATYDPVLISLVRRAMPNLIAYDIAGVQPMTGPTGLIFAMRSRYTNQTGGETFYNEVNTAFSTVRAGNSTIGESHTSGNTTNAVSGNSATYNFAGAMSLAQAEALGSAGNTAFPEMAFSIEKVTVTAGSRALKAEYSMELAQDLKALHGLDAETELANILSAEILAEINREVVRTINLTAVAGSASTTAPGVFDLDVDSNGRWSVEKFKGLVAQISFEANKIALATRRGKGNVLLCSSDVATALAMSGLLSYTPALQGQVNLTVDDTGNTFVGTLLNTIKVYIDPYAAGNYMTLGYKGSSAFDAGLFYCPYVPLQMVRAVGENTFQPKIGFKTRYGMVANPFAQGITAGNGAIAQNSNVYYRRTLVTNIM